MERVPELSKQAEERLQSFPNIELRVGNASGGIPSEAPFDVIISAAASAEIPPAWIEELAPEGRLLHPVADMGLRVLRKDADGRITQKDYPGFVFVPLVADA